MDRFIMRSGFIGPRRSLEVVYWCVWYPAPLELTGMPTSGRITTSNAPSDYVVVNSSGFGQQFRTSPAAMCTTLM